MCENVEASRRSLSLSGPLQKGGDKWLSHRQLFSYTGGKYCAFYINLSGSSEPSAASAFNHFPLAFAQALLKLYLWVREQHLGLRAAVLPAECHQRAWKAGGDGENKITRRGIAFKEILWGLKHFSSKSPFFLYFILFFANRVAELSPSLRKGVTGGFVCSSLSQSNLWISVAASFSYKTFNFLMLLFSSRPCFYLFLILTKIFAWSITF